MYILYLDESGAVERSHNSTHFVLLGVAILATAWREKDFRVAKIKETHRLSDAEIHTAWMIRKYPEQERISGFPGLSDVDRRAAVGICWVNARNAHGLSVVAHREAVRPEN